MEEAEPSMSSWEAGGEAAWSCCCCGCSCSWGSSCGELGVDMAGTRDEARSLGEGDGGGGLESVRLRRVGASPDVDEQVN